jgi:hypothetical protein
MKIPCCKSKLIKTKQKLMQDVTIEADKYMDYVDVLKSLQDVIKLKVILLNYHQQRLFEKVNFKWPISASKEYSPLNAKFKFAKNQKFSEHQITESYHAVTNNQKDEVNKKILELLK